MYFSVDTLEPISAKNKEECCKLNDAFTNIYEEGKFLGEWQDTSGSNRTIDYSSGCPQGSSKCIFTDLINWKVFQFRNRLKIEKKRYDAIEFYLKSEKECNNCLKLKIDDNDFFFINTTTAGIWEKKIIKLDSLGLTNDTFQKFMFQGRTVDSQIFYFNKIKLIKSDYVDNGLCADNIEDDNGSVKNSATTSDSITDSSVENIIDINSDTDSDSYSIVDSSNIFNNDSSGDINNENNDKCESDSNTDNKSYSSNNNYLNSDNSYYNSSDNISDEQNQNQNSEAKSSSIISSTILKLILSVIAILGIIFGRLLI